MRKEKKENVKKLAKLGKEGRRDIDREQSKAVVKGFLEP